MKDVKTFWEDGEQNNVLAEEKMLEAKRSQGGETVQGRQPEHQADGAEYQEACLPAMIISDKRQGGRKVKNQ